MNRIDETSMQARSSLLIGQGGVERLQRAHVMVVGLGGVGGLAAEALCRSGVGRLTVIDGDTVENSNLNRQIVATRQTIGQPKALALAQRLRQIAPQCQVLAVDEPFNEGNAEALFEKRPDFIVDAIDSMAEKLCLIVSAHARGVGIVSATGAGNRLDMQQLRLADVFETAEDPVCRILRGALKKQNVKRHMVAYSTEVPIRKGRPTGSMMFVPGAMGLLLAQYVVEQIRIGNER